eukprot:102160-Amphidinium_carterae.2
MRIKGHLMTTYTGTEGDNRGQVGGVSNVDNENYDNDEYNEEEYDENWDYDNNDPVMIAFNKGKAKGQRKRKRKERRQTKGKEGRTMTCNHMLHLLEARTYIDILLPQ